MHERKAHVEYIPDLEQLARKKRVCAYARVSSDKDEAFHSLSSQISYYQTIIAKRPDWEFAGVFSDRGISGTKENRPGFQEMLEACRAGKIDIILAKSITRFARNTEILLETVRELRSLGIDIHFEEERIETLTSQGEFMISILAARAQEEARSASENQKWRIQKSFQKGIPVVGNCLGYRMVDHQFLIEEDEEQLVRQIFSMHKSGMGKTAIAKKLTEDGIRTRFNKAAWNPNTIMGILRNEKYAGDLLLGKEYRENYISKKKIRNKGEQPMYLVRDAHDSIIDREEFEQTKQRIADRAKLYAPNDTSRKRYPFTGLITCGKCGAPFSRKKSTNEKKYSKPVWMCRTFNSFGKEHCDAQQIPETILSEVTCKALGLESLEGINLRDYLTKIVVPEANKLTFFFRDGTEKTIEWQHRSRRESWTPEMREAMRQTKLAWYRNVKGKENHNGS